MILFPKKPNLSLLFIRMKRGKTPLGVKVWGYFGKNGQFTLFVSRLCFSIFPYSLINAKYMHSTTIAAACEPLRVEVECNGVDSGILWAPSQGLDAFSGGHIEYPYDGPFFRCGGQLVSIWAKLQGVDSWLMSVDSLLLCLQWYFNCP